MKLLSTKFDEIRRNCPKFSDPSISDNRDIVRNWELRAIETMLSYTTQHRSMHCHCHLYCDDINVIPARRASNNKKEKEKNEKKYEATFRERVSQLPSCSHRHSRVSVSPARFNNLSSNGLAIDRLEFKIFCVVRLLQFSSA